MRLWLNNVDCNVVGVMKNKGSIYVDGNDNPDVVEYRSGFVKQLSDIYLPKMRH